MDSEDFHAHSMGFYKWADQWFGRHSKSQPRAHSPWPKDGDMSKHVFAPDSGESDLTTTTTTTTTTSEDFLELARGPSRPFSSAAVTNGQPPRLKSGDVALRCEHKGIDSSAATTLCDVSAANSGLLRPVWTLLRSVTSTPFCKVATSHFGASNWRAGGRASRPFWSLSARPGSPLRAPPMRGPSPLPMALPPLRWMRGTSLNSRSRWHWCHVCCPTWAPHLPGPPPPTLRPQPTTHGAGSRQPASPQPWRTPSQWRPMQCHTWWARAGTPPG